MQKDNTMNKKAIEMAFSQDAEIMHLGAVILLNEKNKVRKLVRRTSLVYQDNFYFIFIKGTYCLFVNSSYFIIDKVEHFRTTHPYTYQTIPYTIL